jgi:1-acyl-sn-glycerol-3-phosphate acyltransferase
LKQSLFKWPIVGQAFSVVHFIPVNRGVHDSAIASLEKATEALRAGQSFLIYPEGTRSPDGRLQRFKKGAVMMAINAGVPIVPMICTGAHKIMEKRSLVIHRGEMEVEFLDPIDSTIYSLAERDILNEQVHKAMTAALPPDQRPISFLEAMPVASPNNAQTESADANRKENV